MENKNKSLGLRAFEICLATSLIILGVYISTLEQIYLPSRLSSINTTYDRPATFFVGAGFFLFGLSIAVLNVNKDRYKGIATVCLFAGIGAVIAGTVI